MHYTSQLCISHKYDQYVVHFLILIVNKYTAGVSLASLLESFGVVRSRVFTQYSDVQRKCRLFLITDLIFLMSVPPQFVAGKNSFILKLPVQNVSVFVNLNSFVLNSV